jgi:hypothetical protein
MSDGPKTTWQMVQIPALITLAVTLFRLIGELQQWSPRFFNRDAGGGGALVGIAWLVPIFGIYFAVRVNRQEGAPESKGKAFLWTVVGLALVFARLYVGFAKKWEYTGYLLMIVSWMFFFVAWSGLARTLFSYGYAARIPVLLVMAIAMLRHWDTHYNKFPPGEITSTSFSGLFWHGAVLPQLVFWITFTVAIGGLFGVITSFFLRKSSPTS